MMSHALALLVASSTVVLPTTPGSPGETGQLQDMAAGVAARMIESAPGPLRIERGAERLPLLVPRDEELVYLVTLDLGPLGDPVVGRVTISSQVRPYQPNLLLMGAAGAAEDAPSDDEPTGETGFIEARARGAYAVYELQDSITCTLLPQSWPSLIHRQVQSGSENRKREVMLGLREETFSGSYRRDGHCKGCALRTHFVKPTWAWQDEHHCKKCRRAEHRVWREPKFRAFPEESVDMLGAVFLARSMLQLEERRAEFPLVDKDELWTVKIAQGQKRRQKVPAGTFEAVEVELVTEVPKGEKGRGDEKFAGLFGIHGTLSIWMHPTGVPVRIRGKVPVGPIHLDVSVKLKSYSGTPSDFRPLR